MAPAGKQARDSSRSYASGARILSVGIAATGVLTFAYFAIASHVLDEVQAKRIDLLWSVMFVIISVIYRPIEQLLSRTIAERRARGYDQHSLRVPIIIQLFFAVIFLALALLLRRRAVALFDGSTLLYWVLVVGTLAYAASYFARGYLAGRQLFGLYGGLVLLESVSRVCFAGSVALGLAAGQSTVALGIAAAPFVSLVVVPAAFARGDVRRATAPSVVTDAALEGPGAESIEQTTATAPLDRPGPSVLRGARFAFAVSGIQLAEQTLLNAAVLAVDATSCNRALAGIVFNVLLIARAPLQLFQAVQTSLLPHLAGLEATEGAVAFGHAIAVTVRAIAAFAAVVAVGLLLVGPFAMRHLFGQHFAYGRAGLAVVGVGMGLHLVAGTLNQAALARQRAGAAAVSWLIAAVLFVAWTLAPVVSDQLLRVELGYAGATAALVLLLLGLYRGGGAASPTLSAASAMAR